MSGHIDLDPEAIFYQHDTDGQLAPVKGRDVDPRRPFVLIPGEDGAFDQGDVLTLCEPCVAGLHESCEDGGETGCDCTDGACAGGEWVPLGMTTAGGQVFTAPAGTPPPGVHPDHRAIAADVVLHGGTIIDAATGRRADPEWTEAPIGPPIPVRRVENRENGRYVEVSVGPAHPAYAAIKAGLTDSLSIPGGDVEKAEPVHLPGTGPAAILADLQRALAATAPRPETAADNGPYVKSGSGPGPSPQVSTLSRTEIERRRGVPLPGRIILPEALGGLPADAPAEPRVVPNRRERRAAAARMERRMRRG